MIHRLLPVIAVAVLSFRPVHSPRDAGGRSERWNARTWSVPRTPWGHPDLQGTYSNDDETGTPMERPAEFAGKTLADITPAGAPEDRQGTQRAIQHRCRGNGVRRRTAAAGASDLRSFDRKNKRAWLVVDPADGRIPRRTDVQPRRRTGGVSTNANPRGPFNSWLDMGLYDRCITRGIPSVDDAGRLRQPIRHHPEPRRRRHPLRDDSRSARHPARRTASRDRSRASTSAMRVAGGRAIRWSSRPPNFLPETAPQGSTEQVVMTERFTASVAGRRRVACDLRGSEHLDAAVDLLDAADQGRSDAADL